MSAMRSPRRAQGPEGAGRADGRAGVLASAVCRLCRASSTTRAVRRGRRMLDALMAELGVASACGGSEDSDAQPAPRAGARRCWTR